MKVESIDKGDNKAPVGGGDQSESNTQFNILHRYGKKDRPVQDFDFTSMYISAALSVAYLALFFFSVPQLAGLAVCAQYAHSFHVAQWVSLTTATVLTLALGIWDKWKVEPFDQAYYPNFKEVIGQQEDQRA